VWQLAEGATEGMIEGSSVLYRHRHGRGEAVANRCVGHAGAHFYLPAEVEHVAMLGVVTFKRSLAPNLCKFGQTSHVRSLLLSMFFHLCAGPKAFHARGK
jgi:hypothetical protein